MSEQRPHQSGWSSPDRGQFASNQYGPPPTGAQTAWQPADPQKSGNGQRHLILGLIGGVAALVLIGVVVWMAFSSGDDAEAEADTHTEVQAAGGDGGEQEEAAGDIEASGPATAHGAVESYLNALAEGDFDAAFSYLQDDPRSSFLTNELIEHSLELAAITDIEVEPSESSPGDYSDTVSYTYSLGGEDFRGDVHLSHSPLNEEWTIGTHGVTTRVNPVDTSSLTLNLNGEPLTSDAEVLYGLAYEMDVEHENFTLEPTDDDGVVVADDTWLSFTNREIILTSDAQEQWRTLIQDDAEECLASTTREAGCGLDLPEEISGDQVIEDSIERSASTSVLQTIEGITPRADHANPNLVGTESYLGSIEVSYDCEGPGGSGRCELLSGDGRQFDRPLVDMAADQLKVVWE